jgi:hypothetical protein
LLERNEDQIKGEISDDHDELKKNFDIREMFE